MPTAVCTITLGAQVQDDATVSSTIQCATPHRTLPSFPTRRSSDLGTGETLAVGNDSSATAALAAGSYHYTVHYSGDGNYNPSDSADEPLTEIGSAHVWTPDTQ